VGESGARRSVFAKTRGVDDQTAGVHARDHLVPPVPAGQHQQIHSGGLRGREQLARLRRLALIALAHHDVGRRRWPVEQVPA
jgi:hypothetical protein